MTNLSRACVALFFVVIGGIEFLLVWYLEQYYIYMIPAVITFNLFFTWLVTNRLLLSIILFPYSSSLVMNHVTRQLNE